MHFTHLLTDKAHSLFLPKTVRENVTQLVSTHQKSKASREMAPFRRQVDFWLLCLGVAVSRDMTPLEAAPSTWGYKFIDTTEVELRPEIYNLLVVIGFEYLDRDPERVANPADIIGVANRLVGASCDDVFRELISKDIRLTPLGKALALADSAIS